MKRSNVMAFLTERAEGTPYYGKSPFKDFVKYQGRWIELNNLNALQKFVARNEDIATVLFCDHILTFEFPMSYGDYSFTAVLRLKIAPDQNATEDFLQMFFRGRTRYVDTSTIEKALETQARGAVIANLRYVDVRRVKDSSPIKSAETYEKLKDICRLKHLHLYYHSLCIRRGRYVRQNIA